MIKKYFMLVICGLVWDEISENGVDEQEFIKHVDIDVLETIAGRFQELEKEIAKKGRNLMNMFLRENGFMMLERVHNIRK